MSLVAHQKDVIGPLTL